MPGTPFDRFATGLDGAMVVVTTASGNDRDGCLVGFHAQCSIEPGRYLVLLSETNRTTRLARTATHLAVHALAAEQRDLAAHFGSQTGDEVDKLAALDWSEGPAGVPLLDACPGRIVGEIVDRRPMGDHIAHVVAPVDAVAPPDGFAPLRLGAVLGMSPGHEP